MRIDAEGVKGAHIHAYAQLPVGGGSPPVAGTPESARRRNPSDPSHGEPRGTTANPPRGQKPALGKGRERGTASFFLAREGRASTGFLRPPACGCERICNPLA